MVSKAHVLSANRPDFNDIMTLQASGVPKTLRQKKIKFVPKYFLRNNLELRPIEVDYATLGSAVNNIIIMILIFLV